MDEATILAYTARLAEEFHRCCLHRDHHRGRLVSLGTFDSTQIVNYCSVCGRMLTGRHFTEAGEEAL